MGVLLEMQLLDKPSRQGTDDMTPDLSKLPPDPWEADESWLVHRTDKSLRATHGFAKIEGDHRNEIAAFAALARNAHAIWLRRRLTIHATDDGFVICSPEFQGISIASDPCPLQAILKADEWLEEWFMAHPKWDDPEVAARREAGEPLPSDPIPPEKYRCHCARDGDCNWSDCPQNRDGEPGKSGRSCPLVLMAIYEW